MSQVHTNFDALLATAHDLAITVVTGQLGPPLAGRMWIGNRSLDTILCPDQVERRVALLIAPGGPGRTTIHIGQRSLNSAGLERLAHNSATSGGSLTQGWLAVLTPETWLARHPSTPHTAASTVYAAATAAGWPASCGNNPVVFLDDVPLYALLAQANVGRTVTLLVGTVVEPVALQGWQIGVMPPDQAMLPQQALVSATHRPFDRAIIPAGDELHVVQQDAWEQPRGTLAPEPTEREPAVGDRITIRQGRRAIPALLDQIGTVVEIFRVPRDSCLVRLEGDTDRRREWFCYHDEVALYQA